MCPNAKHCDDKSHLRAVAMRLEEPLCAPAGCGVKCKGNCHHGLHVYVRVTCEMTDLSSWVPLTCLRSGGAPCNVKVLGCLRSSGHTGKRLVFRAGCTDLDGYCETAEDSRVPSVGNIN